MRRRIIDVFYVPDKYLSLSKYQGVVTRNGSNVNVWIPLNFLPPVIGTLFRRRAYRCAWLRKPRSVYVRSALVRASRRNSVIDEIRCWLRYANDLYNLCVYNTHVRNVQKTKCTKSCYLPESCSL